MDKIREWEPYENDVLMVVDGVIFLYKKGVYRTYDLKTVFGKSSVGSSLIDSIEQCNRVLLNIQLDYNTRSLAFDIKRYFEINEKAVEVLIFKGKQIYKQRIKISGIKVMSHMVGHEWTAVTPEDFIQSV